MTKTLTVFCSLWKAPLYRVGNQGYNELSKAREYAKSKGYSGIKIIFAKGKRNARKGKSSSRSSGSLRSSPVVLKRNRSRKNK